MIDQREWKASLSQEAHDFEIQTLLALGLARVRNKRLLRRVVISHGLGDWSLPGQGLLPQNFSGLIRCLHEGFFSVTNIQSGKGLVLFIDGPQTKPFSVFLRMTFEMTFHPLGRGISSLDPLPASGPGCFVNHRLAGNVPGVGQ